MRLFGPVLAVVLATFAGGAAARADTRPFMTTQEQSFQLFGTSFCFTESEAGRPCDVTLPEPLMTVAPLPPEPPKRLTIFGVTFCGRPEASGPRCDVVWMPPPPAERWRDLPEVRLADATSTR